LLNVTKEHNVSKKRQTRKYYAITEQGLTVLKNVREINNALHVFKEPNMSRSDVLGEQLKPF
jgi:DNA-binding PadR family transcriptional regulator